MALLLYLCAPSGKAVACTHTYMGKKNRKLGKWHRQCDAKATTAACANEKHRKQYTRTLPGGCQNARLFTRRFPRVITRSQLSSAFTHAASLFHSACPLLLAVLLYFHSMAVHILSPMQSGGTRQRRENNVIGLRKNANFCLRCMLCVRSCSLPCHKFARLASHKLINSWSYQISDRNCLRVMYVCMFRATRKRERIVCAFSRQRTWHVPVSGAAWGSAARSTVGDEQHDDAKCSADGLQDLHCK